MRTLMLPTTLALGALVLGGGAWREAEPARPPALFAAHAATPPASASAPKAAKPARARGAPAVPPAESRALRWSEFRRPPAPPFPTDNPWSAAKAELGRTLFFEPLLSGTGTMSCATCHNPSLSWSDGLERALGDRGREMAVRTPTLLDAAWIEPLGWDGKFANLEAVVVTPITSPAIMDLPIDRALDRLAAIPGYADAFAGAFPGRGLTAVTLAEALATFERTILAGPAPFDRWLEGEDGAIGPAAERGFALFTGKARCGLCHAGSGFTDNSFHDIGVAPPGALGRGALVPGAPRLRHAFKTPTLRDVARRAPYMHDGSVPTLRAAIELYDRGGVPRPSLSRQMVPLHLSDAEKDDLEAFLRTLDGAPAPIPVPVLPR